MFFTDNTKEKPEKPYNITRRFVVLIIIMVKKQHEDSYAHILKYTSLFGGVQTLNILVSLIRNKLVAVILGPEGMGLVSLFNSTIKLVSDTTNLGIAMSAVKSLSADYTSNNIEKLRHNIDVIRSWCMVTAIVGMLLCVVFSPVLNRFTFTWGDHTLHFVLLSPIVALTAVTSGETAILKATRQLSRLARISILNVVLALILTTPMYYLWGASAIVPALILMALTQMMLTIGCSVKQYPFRLSSLLSGIKAKLSAGTPMIRLGIAFVLAGMLGSGADFLIRTYLNTHGSLSEVGLFNAGYMMTFTYAGLVFTAMETDYFPRLSACCDDRRMMTITVNRQIEVSLLLLSPLLVLFSVFLPVILPLLFSGKFMPILGMTQVMVLAMYLRSMTLPIAYIPLAKGASKSYLLMESVYDVAVVVAVILCYQGYGLTGTGIAITGVTALEFLILWGYMSAKYGYRVSGNVLLNVSVQLLIAMATYIMTQNLSGLPYWLAGAVLTLTSAMVSLYILRKKTGLWNKLKDRFTTSN